MSEPMKTYQETIEWLAEQTWLKWNRSELGWKGSLGREINAIAFIYGRLPYDVNQDVWAEVINTFGDQMRIEVKTYG
jgi:hypothetical protein